MSEQSTGPKRWEKLGTTPLASTRVFDVVTAKYRHPDRSAARDFFVIQPRDWVNIVALTTEHELVLVRQFRFGIDDFSLEIPGGIIDEGEDFMAAALRELSEETGYVGASARVLGSVHPNPAIQNNRCHLVLIEGARRTAELAWDADEEIEVVVKPVEDVYVCAYRGEITHAMVLDALLLFQPVWMKIKADAQKA